MDADQFVYWLHGFLSVPYLRLEETDEHYHELNIIRNHLEGVINKNLPD